MLWVCLQSVWQMAQLLRWRQGMSLMLAALHLTVLSGQAWWVLLQESWQLQGL